jgi:hypothetical protein
MEKPSVERLMVFFFFSQLSGPVIEIKWDKIRKYGVGLNRVVTKAAVPKD